MNPAQVAQNRTARLVREAGTPVYSTETPSPEVARMRVIAAAEVLACGQDFCHICKRPTDHFAEHSDEQIFAWANTPSMVQSLLARF